MVMSRNTDDIDDRVRELRGQAAGLESYIGFLRTWESNVTALRDITPEQKIKSFDKLYSTIYDLVKQAVDNGYVIGSETDYQISKQAVSITLGTGMRKVKNVLSNVNYERSNRPGEKLVDRTRGY